ncbi:MAG: glycine cleavage system protein GcvH [Bacteroidota bacterium]|jgi:glycine cleavage system H protein|nr:glycine cleavage system protein GcvH [Bacteroidota bacterium]
MNFPEDLKYTDSHEWVKIDNGVATVGITEFAAGELGDVVFVDIPEARPVAAGDTFGSIEAVKTVSDLIAPIAGTITEINPALEGSPETVNSDPYGNGWMVKMTFDNADDIAGLMDAAQYKTLIGK